MVSFMLPALLLSHMANSVASFGCLELLNTTVVEPPQLPATYLPADHCGIGAARQSPAVLGAPGGIVLAPHTAVIQVAAPPEARSAFHASVKSGSVLTSFLSSRVCKYRATCFEAASFIATFHDWPLMRNQRPPACQIRPMNQPGSLGGKSVM